MDCSTTSNATGKDEDTKQDPTETKLTEIASKLMLTDKDSNTTPNDSYNEEDTKQDPTGTPSSYTDPKLVELAGKLHLKPYVQSLFFDTALLFLRKEYNFAAVIENNLQAPSAFSNRKLLIEMATSSFLQEMGIHIWPLYIKNRQHLTIVSPYGDRRKERIAATRQYNLEREKWRMGRRAERPIKPPSQKGLMYLARGRSEIEKSVKLYMGRLVELGCVGEVKEV